jgi:hypothetical protein
MLYHVTRNGQNYGPYTLEDLSRYVASGNVLPTDMAKSDEMTEWVTVASLLEPAASSVPPPQQPAYTETYQPGYAAPPASAYPAAAYDPPPNLSWGLVLLFSILTCSVFIFIWNMILAAWVNRIAPASKVLVLYIAVTVGWLVLSVVGQHHGIRHYSTGVHFDTENTGVSLLWICWWVLKLYARFTMRNELEKHYNTVEPMGLRLSGVMTFFFGGLYFTYHLNRIADMKRAMAYGMPRPY